MITENKECILNYSIDISIFMHTQRIQLCAHEHTNKCSHALTSPDTSSTYTSYFRIQINRHAKVYNMHAKREEMGISILIHDLNSEIPLHP